MDMHFEGVVFQTHAAELARRIERPWPPFALLDVRPTEDFQRGRVPGAVSFSPAPHDPPAFPAGTDATTEFLVMGSDPDDSEVRRVSQNLRQAGARRVVEVPGGLREWKQLRLPVEADADLAA